MAGTIRFACPGCGRPTNAAVKAAGQRWNCPRCGGEMTVPEYVPAVRETKETISVRTPVQSSAAAIPVPAAVHPVEEDEEEDDAPSPAKSVILLTLGGVCLLFAGLFAAGANAASEQDERIESARGTFVGEFTGRYEYRDVPEPDMTMAYFLGGAGVFFVALGLATWPR